MNKLICTCWKCGNKYEVDYPTYVPKCPKCGALAEDEKKSVRTGKTVGNWMMVIGIVVAFLSIFIPFNRGADPNGTFLVLGILAAVLGFFVKAFSKPIN